MPPLVLDDDEAVALVVALRASARLALSGAAEASVDTLAKVVQVLPSRLRQRAEDVAQMTLTADWSESTATVDPSVLATLATVARNFERVEFSYRDRTGADEDRLVEPIRLVMLGRRWYLVAYDLMRHDWRTFRVDRVDAPRSTARSSDRGPCRPETPPSTSARRSRSRRPDGRSSSRRKRPATKRAVASGSGRSSPISDRIGVVSPSQPTGFEWPTMLLASLDADFRVVSPPEFRTHLATVGRRFSRSGEIRRVTRRPPVARSVPRIT